MSWGCIDASGTETTAKRKESLTPILMPSILGICLCFVCVCGMTWAWFTASVETSTQKMTAAYYEVAVKSVTKRDGGLIDPENGKYKLDENVPYRVKLTASGTVDECGGYCLIQNTANENNAYTQTFGPSKSIEVEFIPKTTGSYTFTGVWGSLPTGTKDYLLDIGSAPAPSGGPKPTEPAEPTETAEPAPAKPTDPPTEPSGGTDPVQPGDNSSAAAQAD